MGIQNLSELVNTSSQEIEMIDETWSECHGPKERLSITKPSDQLVTKPLRPPRSRTHGEKRKLSDTDLVNK